VRRSLIPLLALVLVALLFFAPLLLQPSGVLYAPHSDLLAMHLPMKRFLVRSWQETGEIPLWCPHSFGGMPFAHDVQVAAFYPLHLPLYLLPEERVGSALSWLVVLHVLIAGCCAYAYALNLRLRPAAALVAALGFMFAGKWLLHILAGGHYIMTPLAWLPLVLLLLERAIQRASWIHAAWAGAVFALIVLGTHPQMTLYAGLFVAVWTLGAALYADGELQRAQRKRRLRLWLFLGATTSVLAIGLSAIQLLPAIEATREAGRAAGVDRGDILAATGPALLGLLGPGWGEGWEEHGGLGILWLSAALAAPFISRGRVRFEAGVATGLLLFGLGGAVAFQALPGFRYFQLPVRSLMFLALPIAVLAARTTHFILAEGQQEPTARARLRLVLPRVALLAAFLTVAGTVVNFQGWRTGALSSRFPWDWLWHVEWRMGFYWLFSALGIVAAFRLLRPACRLTRNGFAAVWVVLLLADLWAISWPRVAARIEGELYATSPLLARLEDRRCASTADPWRVLERGVGGVPSTAPVGTASSFLAGTASEPVLGYNSFDVGRYKEYLQLITDEDRPLRPRQSIFGYPVVASFPIRNKPLLDLLGVRYLLQPQDAPPFAAEGEPDRDPSWTAAKLASGAASVYSFLEGGVQSLPAYAAFENRNRFPRAFVVPQARPLAERSELLSQFHTTDFKNCVLVEGPFPERPPSPASGTFEPAAITDYKPNRVCIAAKTTAPGWLVLADVWFPGWTCEVDGKAVPIRRANFLFRTVPIPAGEHTVVFQFAPASYAWGRRLSEAILAILISWNIVVCLRRLRARIINARKDSSRHADPELLAVGSRVEGSRVGAPALVQRMGRVLEPGSHACHRGENAD
jgi:hypothetical protein